MKTTIYHCDLCGTQTDRIRVAELMWYNTGAKNDYSFDICDPCYKDLHEVSINKEYGDKHANAERCVFLELLTRLKGKMKWKGESE